MIVFISVVKKTPQKLLQQFPRCFIECFYSNLSKDILLQNY